MPAANIKRVGSIIVLLKIEPRKYKNKFQKYLDKRTIQSIG
jgi:hypothetical protein